MVGASQCMAHGLKAGMAGKGDKMVGGREKGQRLSNKITWLLSEV